MKDVKFRARSKNTCDSTGKRSGIKIKKFLSNREYTFDSTGKRSGNKIKKVPE